jgi:hypothetical protein
LGLLHHDKHYYEAALAVHKEFFVSTNKQSDETFQTLKKLTALKSMSNLMVDNHNLSTDELSLSHLFQQH